MGRKWLLAVFHLLHTGAWLPGPPLLLDVPVAQGGLSRAQFQEILLGFIFNSFYYFFFFFLQLPMMKFGTKVEVHV